MNLLLYFDKVQRAVADTGATNWKALKDLPASNPVIRAMASHDLIFIVLGVTLIIWLILLFFLVRLDREVARLESKVEQVFPTNIDTL